MYGKDIPTIEDVVEELLIVQESVKEDLKSRLAELSFELNQWIKKLEQLRLRYYFLNYVPNQLVT